MKWDKIVIERKVHLRFLFPYYRNIWYFTRIILFNLLRENQLSAFGTSRFAKKTIWNDTTMKELKRSLGWIKKSSPWSIQSDFSGNAG
jgi:hypothetical protein